MGRWLSKNEFLNTFYLAYLFLGEIVLSPDDIWLQITSLLSKIIDDNAEIFRKSFVDHKGKKILEVKYNGTDAGFENIYDPDFRWDIFSDKFAALIKENTKNDIADLMQAEFSTTGCIEKAAS